MTEPDFDQIARAIMEDLWYAQMSAGEYPSAIQITADTLGIAEQLRQVWNARGKELIEEIDTLCQAIEGHRAGALTNDGLWHYVVRARRTIGANPPQMANIPVRLDSTLDPGEVWIKGKDGKVVKLCP